MKTKLSFLLIILVLILSACGKEKIEGSMTLLNQNKEEISFPQDKPTLFFFLTTYT
ncbi:hypothetical protein [Bacillus sp. FJAT-27225]|uniref:hypothetical protein n=1 Tax=Bacillus sp. FJAT-27225 TaxID=1743144 RepID=UPI0015865CAA|nr:hypothetical protein [Bacillus sp. FJAT-27225]